MNNNNSKNDISRWGAEDIEEDNDALTLFNNTNFNKSSTPRPGFK